MSPVTLHSVALVTEAKDCSVHIILLTRVCCELAHMCVMPGYNCDTLNYKVSVEPRVATSAAAGSSYG
eukprot:5006900-Amphidinium_carterae.1